MCGPGSPAGLPGKERVNTIYPKTLADPDNYHTMESFTAKPITNLYERVGVEV